MKRIQKWSALLMAVTLLFTLAAPAALCAQCGGELYRLDPQIRRNGRLLCARCAAGRRGGRRRREAEQEEECAQ